MPKVRKAGYKTARKNPVDRIPDIWIAGYMRGHPSAKLKDAVQAWMYQSRLEKQYRLARANPIWLPTRTKGGQRVEFRRVPTWTEFKSGSGLTEPERYLALKNPAKRQPEIMRRGSILIAPRVLEICTDSKKYFLKSAALLLGLPDGSVLIRGYKGPVPSGKIKYILYEDRAKAMREGQALDKPWKHDVKSQVKMHLTSQGLLITSKQAPLWGIR